MSTPLNVATALRDHARRVPQRRALSLPTRDGGWTHLTYAELDVTVEQCARGLRAQGIGKGTKTAVLVKPGVELFTILFALFQLGAVPVVVDAGMGLRRMLRAFRTVGIDAFIGIPAAQLIRRLNPGTFSSVRTVVSVTPDSFRALCDSAAHTTPFAPAATTTDDALLISFTTGSTGPPKAAVVTHGMVAAMLRSITSLLRPDDGDVTLVTMPVMAVMDVLVGCSAVLAPMDASAPGDVDGRVIADTIAAFGCRHMFASPALLKRLVEHGAPLPSLRSVVSGGAPVSVSLVRDVRALLAADARFETTYGATEALPISSIEANEILTETAADTARGAGTCIGAPVPGLELRLDPVVRVVGDVGEIVIRGELVSPRYVNDDAANAAHKIDGGWHRTGDLGHLDERGRLWFAGRKSHLVHTVNGALASVQVEGIFNAHPDVYRAALVGIGPGDAQEPVVCIQLVDGADAARVEGELHALAQQQPLTAKLRTFLFHPSFPVDLRHNAKIKREELATWARLTLRPPPLSSRERALRAVPLIGWILVVVGLVVPLSPMWRVLWSIDLFFSVVVHGLQLFAAIPVARRMGHSNARTVFMTLLLGVTWWRPMKQALDASLTERLR